MNRHARRAAGKTNRFGASVSDLKDAATKLRPFMEQIEDLKRQLALAAELLNRTRQENAALAADLNAQQALYFHMFAVGMSCSVDEVISMARGIQAQLTQGEEINGIETAGTPAPEETAGDSSPCT